MIKEENSTLTVKQQLHEIRADLQLVEVGGIAGNLLLGWWLQPVKFVADPLLGVAEKVVPAVTSTIPLSENIVSFALGATSQTAHFIHQVGSQAGVFVSPNVVDDARDDFESFIHSGASLVKSAVGFSAGIFTDTISGMLGKEKLYLWYGAVNNLLAYCKRCGMSEELLEEQPDLIPNMILLSKLQSMFKPSAILPPYTIPSKENLEEGRHYMKYATAAYGISTIEAAQHAGKAIGLCKVNDMKISEALDGLDSHGILDNRVAEEMYKIDDPYEAATVTKIKSHLRNSHEDEDNDIDIVAMFVKPGGNLHLLRHFVAVDHDRQAVILAIRGTFSVSEIVIDCQGQSSEFCGGYAHSGIAQQCIDLWKVVGNIIKKCLNEHPGYDLVITGHSLGAGTASLLTIKLYREQLLDDKKTKIRCFAFASPPVYTPLSNAPPLAIENTINYIHDDDCVSFISVANIRELIEYLQEIGNVDADLFTKLSIILGIKGPTTEYVNAYEKAKSNVRDVVEGAPRLLVAASKIIWMRGNKDDGYTAFTVKPQDLPDMTVDIDMIVDHFPQCYEVALAKLSPKLSSVAQQLAQ